jgi:3-oxoacyl-[acyl-carrier protein] reductase
MKKIDLTGKVALVTGATGQLGRTMIRSLAECGADVAICYFSQKEFAHELKEEVEQTYGVKAAAVQADVTDLDSVMKMKQEVNSSLGIVDIIVNNAYGPVNWETVLDQPLEDYDIEYKTCVLHSVIMSKAFVPDMIKQRYGRVIGLNSECSMQLFPYQSSYVSGKRGMDAVYKVLAGEVGPHGITVNQIAPGWIISDGCRDADGTESNLRQDWVYIDRVPLRRRGTDEDIANAVCFLASDLAAFISGAFLPVCGANELSRI